MKFLMRAAVVLFLALLASRDAVAQQHVPFNYLSETARAIKQIQYSHTPPTAADKAAIARMACDAMTRLNKDPDLDLFLREVLFKKLNLDRKEADSLLQNLDEFSNSFLPVEGDLMRQQGYDILTAIDSLRIALLVRQIASVRDLQAETVKDRLSHAQDILCGIATQQVSDRAFAQATWTWGGVILTMADIGGAAAIVGGTWGGGMPAAGTLVLASVGVGVAATTLGLKGDNP